MTTRPAPFALLDWRRRVAALYAEIRRLPDPREAHELWRVTRDLLMATHPESPIPMAAREGFDGLDVAPFDPALRFELEVDVDVPPARLEVPTATDGVVPFERRGVLHVPGLGDLDVWWLASYGGGVWVPVRDGLAATETYGGGRYLLDTVKGADLGGEGDRLVVDLNFAYNPSCAYDPAWACPLAPPGNVIPAPLRAGELWRRRTLT
ncbi:MAG TPA: DUF1684 domain-containing protein [Acidimicrobiales bacterium]|nr:DUF1684 domain-containing protein [Acidimicrobiales bacterium]